MHPLLCNLGPVPVHSYGLMLALAVLASAWLFASQAQSRLGIVPDVIYDLVFWVVCFGIAGARLFFVLLNWNSFMPEPLEILMVWKGGLAWQGSFAGGIAAAVIYIRVHKLPLWPLLDTAAPFIALGHAIGRIGCLLNGCCYGQAASWGLYFPVWDARLIPTQIFMSLGQLAIYVVLRAVKPGREGNVFILYLLLSSMERFGIEFFRADHLVYGGLSIFQYICGIIFGVALVLLMRKGSRAHGTG